MIIKETLYPSWGQFFTEYETIVSVKTDEQELLLINTPSHGLVLLLDGIVQVTEKDNFIYHEMLTHVPILAHGAAQEILILGGGDGGMARHALMHPNVHVTQVEIDESVVSFAKEHLRPICGEAFEHPRFTLEIGDAIEYVKTTDKQFDIVIHDLTDPVGPAVKAYEHAHYENVSKILKRNGIFVTQNGVPFMQADELEGTMRSFTELFTDATCYLATVPTYVGGDMAFGFGTNDPLACNVDLHVLENRMRESGIVCKYYNPQVHKAAFALPNYVQALLT